MKKFLAIAASTIAIVIVGIGLVGCISINSMMFHPVRDYDENLPGLIDIGTNGVKIAAVTNSPAHGRKAILYCHGNAESARAAKRVLGSIAEAGYTVATVDYPGYGLSDGTPDEKGCYRVVHRLYDWLVDEQGFAPSDIIVVGYSIGTGPAVELAATCQVGGLVLQAPFLSAPRVVTKIRILPIDPFPNLKRIGDISCQLAVIHGTNDQVIPFSHGRKLYGLAPEPKRFVAVDGAGHNDLIYRLGLDEYLRILRSFE